MSHPPPSQPACSGRLAGPLRRVGAVILAFLLAAPGARAAGDSDEYEEKARRIGTFIRHTEWPEKKLGRPGTPFVIGIYGSDQISGYLQEIFAGTQAKGHPVQVRAVYSRDDIPNCHVLFISGSERDRLRTILSEARREGVLTVGESDNFLASGGVIQFVRKPDGGWSHTASVANASRERLTLGGFILRATQKSSALAPRDSARAELRLAEAAERDP
jgi:hypothetical protein